MHRRQSGFTLIEIMVVVVILAVLGALVVPKILENVDKARVTRAQSDIRAIQTALDLFRAAETDTLAVTERDHGHVLGTLGEAFAARRFAQETDLAAKGVLGGG